MSQLTKPHDHWNFLNDADSEEHLRWLNQTESLSSLLLRNMPPVQISDCLMRAYDDVKDFQDFVSLVNRLGWVEHTSDWDLILLVELMDGTIYETTPGYSEYWIDGAEIVVEDAPWNDETDDWKLRQPTEVRFRIDNIKTLTLSG